MLEYLEGATLDVRPGRSFTPDEVIDLGLQITDALDAAHAKGIVHRDVKPANIFVTTRSAAKLLDFGIAKLVADQRAVSSTSAPTEPGEGRRGGDWHGAIHVSRAGARRAIGWPDRSLFARHRALRDGDGTTAVRRCDRRSGVEGNPDPHANRTDASERRCSPLSWHESS